LIKGSKDFGSSQVSHENLSEILPSNAAMSKPNGLQSQRSCHCLDQGHTAHWMTYQWGMRVQWLILIMAN